MQFIIIVGLWVVCGRIGSYSLIVIPSYICNNEYISSVSQGISASLTSYFRLGFVAAKINGFFSIYFSDVGIICKLHFTVKEGVLLFSWYFSVLTQFIYFPLQRETMWDRLAWDNVTLYTRTILSLYLCT